MLNKFGRLQAGRHRLADVHGAIDHRAVDGRANRAIAQLQFCGIHGRLLHEHLRLGLIPLGDRGRQLRLGLLLLRYGRVLRRDGFVVGGLRIVILLGGQNALVRQ